MVQAEERYREPVLPLASIRIADLTQAWAGPYASGFLADWGAEVIKVENTQVFQFGTRGMAVRPSGPIPQDQRGWPRGYPDWEPGPRPWNRYAPFNSLNRNKLSMTLDLRRPEGRDIFRELVKVSDVVIENSPPNFMDKAGLGYKELTKVRPDLVMVRMPAYGLTGPYKDFRAWGSHVEGFIGHTWIRSYRDIDPSLKDDVYPSDAVGGLIGAFSTLIALQHRRLTGEGQLIDVPLSEALAPFLAEAFLDYTMNNRVQSALANVDVSMAPHGVYRCRGEDQWVTISVGSDREWEGLRLVMGDPDWAQDERYRTVLGRWRNQEEIDHHIEEWTGEQGSREVMEWLQANGVPAGMAQDASQTFHDPHLRARGFFQQLNHPEAGAHSYPGIIGRLASAPNSLRRPAPCLGEHNEYTHMELLGCPLKRYRELEEAGHIGRDYPPTIT